MLTGRQCDGNCPCKRCKDDGAICTSGTRKVEYKDVPKGYSRLPLLSDSLRQLFVLLRKCRFTRYAEVLENTQLALVSAVRRLYTMIQRSEPWEFGEPEHNDLGQPVVHDILQRLGCTGPKGEDMVRNFNVPEDEASMVMLSRELEEEQHVRSQRQHPSSRLSTQCPDNGGNLSDSVSFDPPDASQNGLFDYLSLDLDDEALSNTGGLCNDQNPWPASAYTESMMSSNSSPMADPSNVYTMKDAALNSWPPSPAAVTPPHGLHLSSDYLQGWMQGLHMLNELLMARGQLKQTSDALSVTDLSFLGFRNPLSPL